MRTLELMAFHPAGGSLVIHVAERDYLALEVKQRRFMFLLFMATQNGHAERMHDAARHEGQCLFTTRFSKLAHCQHCFISMYICRYIHEYFKI